MLSPKFLFFILSFLFAASATKKNSPRYAKNNYYKRVAATQQLVIVEPDPSAILVANTTSNILINFRTIQKSTFEADSGVETVTTFTCNGVDIQVSSILGQQSPFLVDPRLKGNCVAKAQAPNNPEFQASLPVIVPVINPMYYEGTSETSFYTSQSLPIYVRPADDAKLAINFVITCGSVVKTIPIITTTRTKDYVLTPDLVGPCTFTTTNVPNGYAPIDPISVTISPAILFLTPAQNSIYAPGSAITTTLRATDGDSSLSVTVELTCNENLVETKTDNINTQFSFAPSNEIYGTCVLSLADVTGYYTEETVTVNYRSVLSFVLPESGTLIQPGATYDIQVDGTSGTSSVSVTVVGICQVGGTFTHVVALGVKQSFTLDPIYQGFCTLTATTSTPNFIPATTTIQAFTPLTPAETARIAKLLALKGRIFDLTKPYLN